MTEEMGFRVDGRVTLALVVAVAAQTCAALLWTGAAAERLKGVEERLAASGTVAERLARLEEQLLDVRRSLVRIEARMEAREAGAGPQGGAP